jgi:hypothetical protein
VARVILEHWQSALWAALAGLALGYIELGAIYLAPLVRLRLAPVRDGHRIVERERRRLRRLEDALAVREERGDRDAEELRRDAEIHRSILRRMERRPSEDRHGS